MVEGYLRKVETLAAAKGIRRMIPGAIHSSVSGQQIARYVLAIRQVLETKHENAISPDVLQGWSEQSRSSLERAGGARWTLCRRAPAHGDLRTLVASCDDLLDLLALIRHK